LSIFLQITLNLKQRCAFFTFFINKVKFYIIISIIGVLMVISPEQLIAYVSLFISQMNRILDDTKSKEKRENYAKSKVKEALLYCYKDWETREFMYLNESDDKLKEYARLLTAVAVKFHTSALLSLSLFNRITNYGDKMKKIAGVDKNQDTECRDSYERATGELFADMYEMYTDFDKLYETS
jgi:hypothetical protein